jgi:hypothetical protein
LYVAILRLWKRIDEIGADQNTTDDALDLTLTVLLFQTAKRTFQEFNIEGHRGNKAVKVNV